MKDKNILRSYNKKYDKIYDDIETILRRHDALDTELSVMRVTQYIMAMLLGQQEDWMEDNIYMVNNNG